MLRAQAAASAVKHKNGLFGFAFATLSFLVTLSPHAQTMPVTVRAELRDSVSGQFIGDGVVELRGLNVNRSERVGDNGVAVFTRVTQGPYSLAMIRVGFRPRTQSIAVGRRDTTIVVLMVALPTEIAKFQVRASTQEVFGIIGGLPDLTAVVGAKVSLSGASRETTTDSAGKFLLKDVKPGQYVIRITAPGFADRMTIIDLPKGKALESSHLLDASTKARVLNGIAVHDLETRLAFRGTNSAVVSGDELHKHGGTFSTSLQFSREFALKGLQLNGPVCVYLNGRPMPNWPLDGLETDGVAFVEAYGARGDPSGSLAQRWPKGAGCGSTSTLAATRPTTASVKYLVIWTR